MEREVTVIVPTYNNFSDLKFTIESLLDILEYVHLIIVDSSDYIPIDFKFRDLIEKNGIWIKPKGVYNALNVGVANAKTSLVLIMNSGDSACVNNLKQFLLGRESGRENGLAKVYVGFQQVRYKKISYVYEPSFETLWPHQSVIYRKDLHTVFGEYSERYKIISDQLFFEKIKSCIHLDDIYFVPIAFSNYDVTGMSSEMSISNVREYIHLNKIRQRNNVKLYLRFLIYNIANFFRVDFHYIWHGIKVLLKKYL